MQFIVYLAEKFINLFNIGAETFLSWMSNIVPQVLLLLIAMNTLIKLIGESKINKFAIFSIKYPVLRYMIVPFFGAFMLGNPMALSLGKFMPERLKSSYYASATFFCHTSSGIFTHINPGEIFIFLGIS